MCVALTVRICGVDLSRGLKPRAESFNPFGTIQSKKAAPNRVIGADRHQAVNRLAVSYSFLAA